MFLLHSFAAKPSFKILYLTIVIYDLAEHVLTVGLNTLFHDFWTARPQP